MATKSDILNPEGIKVCGIKMIPVCGGKYKVWTQVKGSGSTKVFIVNGGPGMSSAYLSSLEDFLPDAGFTLYFYDQLGCGNSDRPDDESLWNLERYLVEVEEVRAGLGLTDFVLFGHSWGGLLTIEYTLKHQSDGHLKGIVISNMTASIESFLKSAAKWKATLSPELRQSVDKIEADEDWENPEYERIMMEELYPKMMCRIKPWPEPVTRTFKSANMKIYVQMQGHSEFSVTGNLKGWDSWDRLPQIKVKALVLGAEHDEMDPDDCRKMAEMMPNAEVAICPQGSHLALWDDQEVYYEYLLKFLRSL